MFINTIRYGIGQCKSENLSVGKSLIIFSSNNIFANNEDYSRNTTVRIIELCGTVLVVWIGTLNRHCICTTSHLSDVAHAPFDSVLYIEGKSVHKETYLSKHLWVGYSLLSSTPLIASSL
jgi:hypothetical protein